MHLDIACHHTTLTPAMRQHAEEKLSKLARHTAHPLNAHLVLTVDGAVHRAEATISIKQSEPIHASGEADSMYAAVDELVSLLDRQLRKIKTSRLRKERGQVPGINGHAVPYG